MYVALATIVPFVQPLIIYNVQRNVILNWPGMFATLGTQGKLNDSKARMGLQINVVVSLLKGKIHRFRPCIQHAEKIRMYSKNAADYFFLFCQVSFLFTFLDMGISHIYICSPVCTLLSLSDILVALFSLSSKQTHKCILSSIFSISQLLLYNIPLLMILKAGNFGWTQLIRSSGLA